MISKILGLILGKFRLGSFGLIRKAGTASALEILLSSFWKMSEVDHWAVNTFSNLFSQLFSGGLQRFTAIITAMAQIFSFIFFTSSITPFGQKLDLSGYELVFEDEFDGDSIDLNVWQERGKYKTEFGYYDLCQAKVENGKLNIKGSYLPDGPQGPGWYTTELALKNRYTYGYFECTCKINKGNGFWSAFWLQNGNSSSKDSKGGINGVEIDIMESCANNSTCRDKNCVIQCMHVNGGTGDTTDDVDTTGALFINAGKDQNGKTIDLYNEYVTYGMMWDEEEYVFYVNGVESWRSSWRDGVSTVPEEVILSMCIPPYSLDYHPKDFETDFSVESIRIYQRPDIGKIS